MLKAPLESASSAYAYPLLIRHLLHTPLAHAPEREIVYGGWARYTYLTFRQRIGRLASGLTALGVRAGHTVAVMDWDSHRYLECYFAVPMMGAVLHTINIRLSPEQMLYTINHAGDDVILVHRDFVPVLGSIRDRIERPVKIVLLDEGEIPADDADGYETLLAGADPAYEFPDFDENTRATTFYTTGTTGDPKGVSFSHRQIVLHTLAWIAVLGTSAAQGRLQRDDVYMPMTPMFHVHGWGFPYVATLLGLKQVYPGRYLPHALLELVGREKVTFSHCVPTILQMLLESSEAARVDLRGWRVVVGGAAMPKGLARRALAHGIDVFSAYGMSETCPLIAVSQLDRDMLEAGEEEQVAIRCRSGRAAPLVELRVVDDSMQDVPRDGRSTGEIVVRAPWLTTGYLREREHSETLWRGGYLHTGDIATIDPRGYVQITDRLKDVIKTGGEWISSLELESIISQHEAVREVAAIGVPHEKWGERPLALVVPKPGHAGSLTEEAIQKHVRSFVEKGVLSSWAVPDRVRIVDAIEKTTVGKFDKKLLRQKYAR